jgi:4-amino-4-deoxy-L-arabinose transferase-like glycosyltransferase
MISLLGAILSLLMILFALFFTPDYAANKISPDGNIGSGTITEINIVRSGFGIIGTFGLFSVLLFIFKPNLFNLLCNEIASIQEKFSRSDVRAHYPYIVIAIILFGGFLRFYGLDNQSFWNDELASLLISNHDNLSSMMIEDIRPDVHPPGYQIILFYIEKYIGTSETALRFPSALSGTISLFIIFLLGKQIYTYKEGIISSALMAVSWCPIYYSQEARAYSMLLLFSLLTTYFWVIILKRLKEKKQLPIYHYSVLGYVISAIVAIYLHYFGLLLIGLQGICITLILYRKPRALFYSWLIYLPIVIAYLPWLPIFREHLNRDAIWIRPPDITAFIGYIKFIFNESTTLVFLVVFVFYSYLIIRLILNLKQRKNSDAPFLYSDLLVVLWLVGPFMIAYIQSLISSPVLTSRNLIISVPAAFLLLSRSIVLLPFHKLYKAAISLIVASLILGNLLFIMNYYTKPHKEQFREAAEFLTNHDKLYQQSLIIGYAWVKDYFNYYFQRSGCQKRIHIIAGEEKDILPVKKIIHKKMPQYIWYIRGHRIPEQKFIDFLHNSFSLITHKKLVGSDVWLFKNS